MKRIVCTVTNDLLYDQRMIRICHSLARNGYQVTLVGRRIKNSLPLENQAFEQKRLFCFFAKGKLFYIEFNIRLFFFLLFHRTDVIVAIDLDTILPCYLVSKIRFKERVYDAHELFCEMKEIATRPFIYRCWKALERFSVPHFRYGYTVNQPIADEFKKMYGVQYEVIRNIPLFEESDIPAKPSKYIIYQGAVNEGRSFETLIPAMKWVDAPLLICGDGNFMEQARALVRQHQLEGKVIFKGKLLPAELVTVTRGAWVGVTLFDAAGKSNYYSLANRFFDYLHAGIPQLCVDYPVYREINNRYGIAVLTDNLEAESLAFKLNDLLNNQENYKRLQQNCLRARRELSWQEEEKKLIEFYKKHFG
jgi:glycosyltransferase involved in cell wall biosynthesis